MEGEGKVVVVTVGEIGKRVHGFSFLGFFKKEREDSKTLVMIMER